MGLNDEVLDPQEMSDLFQNMGQCSSAGGKLMKEMFDGEKAPFTFKGDLSGVNGNANNRRWRQVFNGCSPLDNLAQSTVASKASAASLLLHTGDCMKDAGHAIWKSAARHPQTECMNGILLALPAELLSRTPTAAGRRRAAAMEFLAQPR